MKAPDKSSRVVLSGDGGKTTGGRIWRRVALGAVGVALAGAASGAVWVAYNQGIVAGTETAAPLIRASVEETRRRPEDPGGMDVPNRDKLVFNRIAPDVGEVRLERLLPPPEAPLPRPGNGAPAAISVMPAAPPEVAAIPAAAVEKTTPAPEKALVPETPAKQLVIDVPPPPVPTPAKAPPLKAVVPPAPDLAAIAPAAGPAAEAWRVQLAAMRTPEAASKVWTTAVAKYNDLLGALRLNVDEVTIGEKGTFYRVQAGPLDGRKQADALCAALKIRDQGCLVVKP